jgi:pimeloyl-ACP methyl ester carboxylesterase
MSIAVLPPVSYQLIPSGNHETPGTWSQGGFADDVEDLSAVANYLQGVHGYVIAAVVGHSRGSLVGMRWISTSPAARDVTAFINVSGRYRMVN